MLFDRFTPVDVPTGATIIHASLGGSGPAVLLLHGFPQTHRMWRSVASTLSKQFTVVCADLRGYGDSGCPPSDRQHAPYAKRALAQDMVALMAALGFARFAVVGHDRGGRVAYRLALDHPQAIERAAVLDVLPVDTVWQHADERFALGYWPWSLLAQEAPLPEQMLMACADEVVEQALAHWGTPADAFTPTMRAAYARPLRDADHAHAICEEYRAAASIDREHDRADVARGRRIACPLLALWSVDGPLASWYESLGGPLDIWRAWCDDDVQGAAVPGGHFFPEAAPHETAAALQRFLRHA
jgi:haloacetate dehalogenase